MPPETYTATTWLCAYIGAFMIGFSKSGITGTGIVAIALFAYAFPAFKSVGLILPLLVFGDALAVLTWRRNANWGYLARIFPWSGLGVVIGYFLLMYLQNRKDGNIDGEIRIFLGALLVTLTSMQFWRWYREKRAQRIATETGTQLEVPAISVFFAPFIGIFGGIVTMVGNAAGPLLVVYLLAMRLPKIEFVGTAAWYFFIVNVSKIPFSAHLGLIDLSSLTLNLQLAPGVLLGAFAGPYAIKYLNQRVFEWMALCFAALAGVKMLLM